MTKGMCHDFYVHSNRPRGNRNFNDANMHHIGRCFMSPYCFSDCRICNGCHVKSRNLRNSLATDNCDVAVHLNSWEFVIFCTSSMAFLAICISDQTLDQASFFNTDFQKKSQTQGENSTISRNYFKNKLCTYLSLEIKSKSKSLGFGSNVFICFPKWCQKIKLALDLDAFSHQSYSIYPQYYDII